MKNRSRLLALSLAFLALLALLLLQPVAPAALAQFDQTARVVPVPLAFDYDPGTSYVYCKYTGASSLPGGSAFVQTKKIKNAGSGTDAVANTAGQLPFADLSVGDWLEVRQPAGTNLTTVLPRYVVTKTDGDNITVNLAWDLSTPTGGFPFTWRKLSCGTGAENGWLDVGQLELVRFSVAVDQLNAISADILVQCRDRDAVSTPVSMVAKSYTAVGGDGILVSAMLYDQCRLGMKVTGDSGAQKITANFRGI